MAFVGDSAPQGKSQCQEQSIKGEEKRSQETRRCLKGPSCPGRLRKFESRRRLEDVGLWGAKGVGNFGFLVETEP